MNPFAYRPEHSVHTIRITLENDRYSNYIAESLSDSHPTIAIEENQLILYQEQLPDIALLEEKLRILSSAVRIAMPQIIVESFNNGHDLSLATKDKGSRIRIGGYRIGNTPALSPSDIHCEALHSFGDGHHPTTNLCLRAIYDLSKYYTPAHALDLGCGSGILSLMMQRVWPKANVTASDQDPYAVGITRKNCLNHRWSRKIKPIISDGFQQLSLKSFQVIVANLLLNIHLVFRKEIFSYLHNGGYLILSGLKTTQLIEIVFFYKTHGMRLMRCYEKNGWSVAVLCK